MSSNIEFSADLLRRYNKSGPRYTSYPTALEFKPFSEKEYKQQIELSNQSGSPLSLYYHLPFCDTVCYYCACNKIITKNRKHAQPYLTSLRHEIAMQASLFDNSRQVTQIHWGGGTPTFFSNQQMEDLMLITRAQFNVANDDEGEFSIEIDPREVSTNTIDLLRKIGFNRISIGVQDIDKDVQVAVNRIQSPEQTTAAIKAARDNNFHSISVDLIYGLPKQTAATFAKTLDYIIEQSPDRISVFNYAHLPERFKVQRQINEADLPSAEQKLVILQSTINTLLDAGYLYIGMDHFAKPTDALAKAQQDKRLYRNFQGYSTQAECDLIGMGMTSIGHIGDSYVQNQRLLLEYTNDIGNNKLAISKGFTLSLDDKIRKQVISELICHFQLDIKAIEKQFGITFADYFGQELQLLDPMIDDGLLYIQKSTLFITPPGRLLIRNICMVFDYYIQKQKPNRFSKVI